MFELIKKEAFLKEEKSEKKNIYESLKFCVRDDLINESIKIGNQYEIIAMPIVEFVQNRPFFYFEVKLIIF